MRVREAVTWALVGIVLAGCGGVSTSETEGGSCGWELSEIETEPEPGHCALVRFHGPNERAAPRDASCVDVDTVGVQCAVLLPGDSLAVFTRDGARGEVELVLSEGSDCPLSCD
jgi:hypothetical protein